MKISRRRFSQLLLGLLATPDIAISSAIVGGQSKVNPAPDFYASAAKGKDNQYYLQVIDNLGRQVKHLALPARAHQVIAHPYYPWLLVVARRPGYYIKVFDYQEGVTRFEIESKAGYHFYGHAVFSPDGRFLVTTEHHIAKGHGRLVMRDAEKGFVEVADYPSYGIGPHQLSFLSDQQTLVVANGGILTHPDRGREKLNLDTMEPSLDYIDFKSGALLEKQTLAKELHQLSIRHLAVNNTDQVVAVMQYQGGKMDNPPLVATHRRGEDIRLLAAPETVNRSMKQYCGSVSIDTTGSFAAVSSPRGNIVTIWDIDAGKYVNHFGCSDGCGIATAGTGGFMISTGTGRFYHYDLVTRSLTKKMLDISSSVSWDNHLTAITTAIIKA